MITKLQLKCKVTLQKGFVIKQYKETNGNNAKQKQKLQKNKVY